MSRLLDHVAHRGAASAAVRHEVLRLVAASRSPIVATITCITVSAASRLGRRQGYHRALVAAHHAHLEAISLPKSSFYEALVRNTSSEVAIPRARKSLPLPSLSRICAEACQSTVADHRARQSQMIARLPSDEAQGSRHTGAPPAASFKSLLTLLLEHPSCSATLLSV